MDNQLQGYNEIFNKKTHKDWLILQML